MPQKSAEEILDLALALTPQVAPTAQGDILFSLAAAARYWKLPTLKEALEAQDFEHPFLSTLKRFHERFGLRFVLAPTAPWASFLLPASQNWLEIYSTAEVQAWLQQSPLERGEDLLQDFLRGKAELTAPFFSLCDELRELGLKNLAHVGAIFSEPQRRDALLRRFGPVAEKLLRRLQGADDWRLKWHEPSEILRERFELGFDHDTSHSDEGPLPRLRALLGNWEDRLRARRKLLSGFKVRVRSFRKRCDWNFVVSTPRPTREAEILFRVLEEKWLSLCQDSKNEVGFEDEIDEIEAQTLSLVPDSDRQLDLFNPRRESQEAEWNALIARLRTQAEGKGLLRIGFYRPYESFFPENALEWVEWEDESALPAVAEHPRRPELLLSPAQPWREKNIASEDEFLHWVADHQGTASLEKLRDPWTEGSRERLYARVDQKWLYWDKSRHQVFLHGIFEERRR